MTRRGHALLAIKSATVAQDNEAAVVSDEIDMSASQAARGEVVSADFGMPATPPSRGLVGVVRELVNQSLEQTRQTAETAAFRERLLAQQYRARELFRSNWLRVPGVAPLILLADQALGLVKRLQAAIERRGNLAVVPEALPADSLTDNATLETWLQSTDVALDQIERQFAYFETTCRMAESLREVSQRLLSTERVSYSDLLPMAERVVESISEVTSVDDLFPIPGVQMGSVLQGAQACELPAIYTQGVQCARFAAWSLAAHQGWRRDLPDLLLAALFQDIGWLSLRPYIADANRRGPRRVQWLAQQHPQVGAAILGGVFRAPLTLPQMVGLHHERLNGTGYPRRLGISAISRSGRMLGCLGRLYELYAEMALEVRAGDTANHIVRVANGLQQEATRGWWDTEYATDLLAAIPRADSAKAVASVDEPVGADPAASQPNRELHGEQPELQGGHVPLPAKGFSDFGMRSTVTQSRRG